ncbi:MAG TPA: hypothetical protein VEJ16_14500 [Alphaproteobacteria bacterium]|nr:hypothetical protein [Alphaproteobacteria bacterium]
MAERARKREPVAPPDLVSRRVRARNWAIFAVLAGLVVLFYTMTVVRMGGGAQ